MTLTSAGVVAALLLPILSCDESQVAHRLEPGLERMMDQPRGAPFAPSEAFDDGRAMRTPPPGTLNTVPEAPPYLLDGAFVDRIPYPVTRSFLARGRSRFEVTCAACHGVLGDGRSVVATKMELRPPPSLHIDRIRALRVGEIEEVIENGYGFMGSYAAVLAPEDRWAVVAYVRALELSQGVKVASLPPSMARELSEAVP